METLISLLKQKRVFLLINLIFIVLYIFTTYYWLSVCRPIGCQNEFRDNFLFPVREISIFVIPIFTLFIFLPTRYSHYYLTRFLSWGAPLAFLMVVGSSTSAMLFNKMMAVQLVQIFLVVAAVLSIIRVYTKKQ